MFPWLQSERKDERVVEELRRSISSPIYIDLSGALCILALCSSLGLLCVSSFPAPAVNLTILVVNREGVESRGEWDA